MKSLCQEICKELCILSDCVCDNVFNLAFPLDFPEESECVQKLSQIVKSPDYEIRASYSLSEREMVIDAICNAPMIGHIIISEANDMISQSIFL